MNECRPMVGVKFDASSKALIERIYGVTSNGKLLSIVLAGGVLSSIFTKSSPPAAAYNITQTDWVLFSSAMRSVPETVKAIINKEINMHILDSKMDGNFKIIPFWEAVRDGCQTI